jgi:WD40 repeat protein
MNTPDGFYVAGGSLHADSPSYVERRADAELYEGLRRGEFCYVLTPRQMGKSSLMVRTAVRLREEGVQVVVLDLTAIGRNLDTEQWYYGLLDRLGEQLDLEDELEEFWLAHERMGPLQRFLEAVHEVALLRCAGALVIFVDEIDVVRSLPFSTDEFFAGIRECYNRRADDAAFARMTFCLLGAAAPTDLVQDTRITPFNIGRRIELEDFSGDDAATLSRGLPGEEKNRKSLLKRILHWTGGHPYLTQRLCKAAAWATIQNPKSKIQNSDVDRLCGDLFLSRRAQERDDNLLFVRDRLLRSDLDLAALLDLYSKVWRGRRVPDDEANPLAGLLRLSGIVRACGGVLRVRNRIYAHVFDDRWAREHVPDAEVRRQRAAYRRGMLRTASLAAVIVLVMAVLVGTAMSFAHRAERNRRLAESNRREADRRTAEADRLAGNLREALAQKNDALKQVVDAVWAEKARAEEARQSASIARRERDYARSERARADRESRASHERLTRLTVASGVRALEADDATGALLWFVHALQMDRGKPEREAVDRIRIGTILAGTPRLLHCWFGVTSGELSPDGRRVVTVHRDGTARVWDAESGAPQTPPMAHGNSLKRALFSPDGRWVLTIGGLEARVWNVATGRLLAPPLHHDKPVNDADWSPDSRRVVTGSADRGLRVWEPTTGKVTTARINPVYFGGVSLVRFGPDGKFVLDCHHGVPVVWDARSLLPACQLQGPRSDVWDLRFSPDGRRIAVAESGGAFICDAATGNVVTPRMDQQEVVKGVRFSPDGRRLVTTGFGQQRTQVWDADTGLPAGRAMEHRSYGHSAVYSADGRFITTAADEGSRVWDALTREPVTPVLNHGVGGAAIFLSPDGRRLLVVNSSGSARLWELSRIQNPKFSQESNRADAGSTRAVIQNPRTLPYHGTCAYFSPDGARVIVGAEDGTAHLVGAATGRNVCPALAHGQRVDEAAFSPDGRRVATVGKNGLARVWDASTGRLLLTLTHPTHVWTARFCANGRRLATTTYQAAYVWDLATGKVLCKFADAGSLSDAEFSPDCTRLLTWDRNGSVQIRDLASSRLVATLRHREEVTAASFSPDGRRVVTASLDDTARVWDAETGRPITPPLQHGDDVQHACFSPDGRRIATACGVRWSEGPREARIWDAATGKALTPALIHNRTVQYVGFSPDGRMVVTGSADGGVHVWDAATGEPVTPLLRMPGQVYYAEISRGSRHVLAASNDGTVRLWDLPAASGSPQQLTALAELVSARRLDSGGGLASLDDAAIVTDARRLRAARSSSRPLVVSGAP